MGRACSRCRACNTCCDAVRASVTSARFAPSTPESLAHARITAAAVHGVDFRALDIARTVDVEAERIGLMADLEQAPEDALLRLAFANLKARIRAVRLRYFANRLEGLVLGTENKTEHYLGYFTIGGDEESDLEILANYLKCEVRQLASALRVPVAVIDKAPSADLWAGQTDEGELGFSYQDADHVLHVSQCGTDWSAGAQAACNVAAETAERVLRRVRATAFKRASKPVFPRP